MSKIAIVYHSLTGLTKLQAEAVHRGVLSVEGAEALFLTAEEASSRLVELDGCDAIVFGAPTYMGSMSAGMKAFLEAAVDRWSTRAWQDKIAGAFTNSANFSGDKLSTLFGLAVNAMQQGMIFVSLGMLPGSNEPDSMKSHIGPSPDGLNRVDSAMGAMATSFFTNTPSKGDLDTAEAYGRRIALITAQFLRGRQ